MAVTGPVCPSTAAATSSTFAIASVYPADRREPSTSGAVDPLVGAVRERLVLPDRELPFDLVHQVRAARERLRPVLPGHRARQGHVPDLQLPDPVTHRDPAQSRPGPGDLAGDPLDHLGRARVPAVLQLANRPVVVVVP